jgi:hypothetical protein
MLSIRDTIALLGGRAVSLTILTSLPHANDGQPGARQAGNNYAGNQHADENGEKGVLEFDSEEDSRQSAGPGTGYRQGNGNKQCQADSLILLDDFPSATRPLEEPAQDAVEEPDSAEEAGGCIEEEQDKRYRQQVADNGQQKGVIPVEVE